MREMEFLPFEQDLETKKVLKQVALSERALGELKGVIKTVPNESVLINTLFLQEAKSSSEIENIITTQDEVFRSNLDIVNSNTKEVQNYKEALLQSFEKVKIEKLLCNRNIKEIQENIVGNNAGFRVQSGTKLKNNSGEVIYTPPQDAQKIETLMMNLEKYINDDELCGLNPLVKMTIIHHQFESIHPFYDGNGRTGRIINIIYLTLKGLLDIPVLYLSRYIVDNKKKYYELLQNTRNTGNWEEWILFMLEGIEKTAKQTIQLIKSIVRLMQDYKNKIRSIFPKMYSQDLINTLFKHPYTKISFLAKDLNCNKQKASKYLNQLADQGFLSRIKLKNSYYYINDELCKLFLNIRNL